MLILALDRRNRSGGVFNTAAEDACRVIDMLGPRPGERLRAALRRIAGETAQVAARLAEGPAAARCAPRP